jgi:peptidoglycan hydrolase FlgJ
MSAAAPLAPGLTATLPGSAPQGTSIQQKARASAQDFEAMFLNVMFGQMFANVGNGPFGGGPAANVWRSFLTDEYAKNLAQKGGIGLADHVYGSLLAIQEARGAAHAAAKGTAAQ